MSRLWIWCAVVVVVGAAIGGGCGEYRLTRPPYDQANNYAIYSNDEAPDIAKIEARFPELKGLVMTAPEYNAELEREAAQRPPDYEHKVRSEYAIQPGVTLTIEVIGEAEFTRVVTVNVDGSFDYPYVGQIDARGLTLTQLKEFMVRKLKYYLKDPQVVINATIVQNQFSLDPRIAAGKVLVNIAGTSQTPPFTGQETLAGILTITNGFNPAAERREVRVIKPRKGHRRARIIISDMQALFMYGDMAQDIPMEINDIVYVPAHWTQADQFTKDWGLALQYIQQALSSDQLLQAWNKRLTKPQTNQ